MSLIFIRRLRGPETNFGQLASRMCCRKFASALHSVTKAMGNFFSHFICPHSVFTMLSRTNGEAPTTEINLNIGFLIVLTLDWLHVKLGNILRNLRSESNFSSFFVSIETEIKPLVGQQIKADNWSASGVAVNAWAVEWKRFLKKKLKRREI